MRRYGSIIYANTEGTVGYRTRAFPEVSIVTTHGFTPRRKGSKDAKKKDVDGKIAGL